MSKEHIKGLGIISSLLMIMGLVLMFFSVSIGTYIGDSWVSSQPGINDGSRYMLVIETYINNLVIKNKQPIKLIACLLYSSLLNIKPLLRGYI